MIRSKNWWLITLKGIIFIFLGSYIFRFPVSGMLGLVVFGGFSLLLTGFVLVIFAIISRKENEGWKWQIAQAFLDGTLAAILLFNIWLSALTLPFVFGFYGILMGILWFIESLFLKKRKYKLWHIATVAGIFSLLTGIVIFFQPLINLLPVVTLIGFMFILQGFFLTLFSLEINRAKKIFQANDVSDH